MPKVTLLAETWQDYLIPFGKRDYLFRGGKGMEVPHAVALFCKNKQDSAGEPIFKVTGLDHVVVPVLPAKPVAQQNVDKGLSGSRQFTQLRLIEAELCH